jgi:hypothetical protein
MVGHATWVNSIREITDRFTARLSLTGEISISNGPASHAGVVWMVMRQAASMGFAIGLPPA